MTTISSHVLNTTLGIPAQGIQVVLEYRKHDRWMLLTTAATNTQGRMPAFELATSASSHLRLRFAVLDYFKKLQLDAFFPEVSVEFVVDFNQAHYHIPLLINPFGYSTYRGS